MKRIILFLAVVAICSPVFAGDKIYPRQYKKIVVNVPSCTTIYCGRITPQQTQTKQTPMQTRDLPTPQQTTTKYQTPQQTTTKLQTPQQKGPGARTRSGGLAGLARCIVGRAARCIIGRRLPDPPPLPIP